MGYLIMAAMDGAVMAKWVIVFRRYAQKRPAVFFRGEPFPMSHYHGFWTPDLWSITKRVGPLPKLALRNPALGWHSAPNPWPTTPHSCSHSITTTHLVYVWNCFDDWPPNTSIIITQLWHSRMLHTDLAWFCIVNKGCCCWHCSIHHRYAVVMFLHFEEKCLEAL